jgi:hypothetical protein
VLSFTAFSVIGASASQRTKDLPSKAADGVESASDSTPQQDKGDIEFLTTAVKNLRLLSHEIVQHLDKIMLFSRLQGLKS